MDAVTAVSVLLHAGHTGHGEGLLAGGLLGVGILLIGGGLWRLYTVDDEPPVDAEGDPVD